MTGNNDGDDGGGSERGRGIVTPADRDYLRLSEEEREEKYSQSARIQRRNAIADRVENALLDFPLLAKRLDDKTVDDVFGADRTTFEFDGEEIDGTEIPKTQYGVTFALWFLLRVDRATKLDLSPVEVRAGAMSAVSPFIDRVERGIELWLNSHDLTGDVELDLSISQLQRADELAEQLEAAEEPLSAFDRIRVVSQLGRAGYSDEEIAKILGEDVPDDARGDE